MHSEFWGFTLDLWSVGQEPLLHLASTCLIRSGEPCSLTRTTTLQKPWSPRSPAWNPVLLEMDLSLVLSFGLWPLPFPHYRIPYISLLLPHLLSYISLLSSVSESELSAQFEAVLPLLGTLVWGSRYRFVKCDLAKIFRFSASQLVRL